MKIKCNRGPLKNNRYEIIDGAYEYMVQMPKERNPSTFLETACAYPGLYGTIEFMYKRGSYMKSNVQLKDGTWVFEWMGWRE